MTDENSLGNAGYAIIGSGGGGGGGNYMFASLEELDSIIAKWVKIRDGIATDRSKLLQAQAIIEPPAEDEMSTGQSAALVDSLTKAIDHNKAMSDYADSYIEKLTAARNQYAADDERSAAHLRGIDGE